MQDDFTSNNIYGMPMLSTQLVPPALPRLASIPLPPLSPNVLVQTHTLITYRPHISLICWTLSLPPSTARLAMTTIGSVNRQWFYDAAILPTTFPSITIRIRGIERPLVVFPFEVGNPIRIIDILYAVYSAAQTTAIEHRVASGDVPGYYGLSVQIPRDLAVADAAAADAIGRYFRNRVWWNGLLPSVGEADVWVLQLRGATRRRFPR